MQMGRSPIAGEGSRDYANNRHVRTDSSYRQAQRNAPVEPLSIGRFPANSMIDTIRRSLSEDGFMPHGMCYLWRPSVLSLHLVSDALITLAYFSIPFTLVYGSIKAITALASVPTAILLIKLVPQALRLPSPSAQLGLYWLVLNLPPPKRV
jgi:hypothetical protein